MKIISPIKAFMASNTGWATSFSIVTLIGAAAVALLFFHSVNSSEGSGSAGLTSHGNAEALQLRSSPHRPQAQVSQ